MTKVTAIKEDRTDHSGYQVSRFNAMKHGVLSKYTVLAWENPEEYEALYTLLVEEHGPVGPTEGHLVEEVAGIFWRKRRLRLAEASAVREGLHATTGSYRNTGEAALVCVNGGDGNVAEALRASPDETEQELREFGEVWQAADKALAILRAGKGNAYESALKALQPDTRDWWLETVQELAEAPEAEAGYVATADSLAAWLEEEAISFFRKRRAELVNRDAIREHALGMALMAGSFEKIARYETHLDRKLERTLAMLIKLQLLRHERTPDRD